MHVAVLSSATYASIDPGTANSRRVRANDVSAAAGVRTDRTWMPAFLSGSSAAVIGAAAASATTTGRRGERSFPSPAGAMSESTPRVSIPAPVSATSASRRIASYERLVTITWR